MTKPRALQGYVWDDTVHPEDINAIRVILRDAGIFSAEEVGTAAEVAEQALDYVVDYAFVFARSLRGKKLAGYACFGAIPLTEGRYDLYWIAVDPALCGQGLGDGLLKRVEQRVKGSSGKVLYAETSSRDDHGPGRDFYIKHGFGEVARLPQFYNNREDKIIYSKNI